MTRPVAAFAIALIASVAAIPFATQAAVFLPDPLSDAWTYCVHDFGDGCTPSSPGVAPFGQFDDNDCGLTETPLTSWPVNTVLEAERTLVVPPGATQLNVAYRVDNAIAISVDGVPHWEHEIGFCDLGWYTAPSLAVLPGQVLVIHATAEDYGSMSWFDMAFSFTSDLLSVGDRVWTYCVDETNAGCAPSETGLAPFGQFDDNDCGLSEVPLTDWPVDTILRAEKEIVVPSGATQLTLSYRVDNAVSIFVDGALHHQHTIGNCDLGWYDAPTLSVVPGQAIDVSIVAEDYGSMSWFDMRFTYE